MRNSPLAPPGGTLRFDRERKTVRHVCSDQRRKPPVPRPAGRHRARGLSRGSRNRARLRFEQVLLANGGGSSSIGTPSISGALVEATVVNPEVKGKKLEIGKFRRRKNSRRHTGHRQKYTSVHITAITVPGLEIVEKPAEEKKAEKKAPAKKAPRKRRATRRTSNSFRSLERVSASSRPGLENRRESAYFQRII